MLHFTACQVQHGELGSLPQLDGSSQPRHLPKHSLSSREIPCLGIEKQNSLCLDDASPGLPQPTMLHHHKTPKNHRTSNTRCSWYLQPHDKRFRSLNLRHNTSGLEFSSLFLWYINWVPVRYDNVQYKTRDKYNGGMKKRPNTKWNFDWVHTIAAF